MRNIIIKSLSLVNFKGIRALDLNFSDTVTVIAGDNGTGKTTVFDAFLWLLFGKDSTGRSDSNFNIKTLDENGKPILKIDHSVTAVLCVDGTDIKIQRVYLEKWEKPRGTTEEILKNHKTEYWINDVKLSTKKEFDARISEIVYEDVFKMITNPFYFTSLSADDQKNMLLDMAGTISDNEVAQIKPEYVDLLAQLSGRSLDEFKSEVAARKRACKEVLNVVPSQIETANRLKPEAEDWDAIENEISVCKGVINNIDSQISDKSKVAEQENNRKLSIQRTIGQKQLSLANRENELVAQANAGRNESILKAQRIQSQIKTNEREIQFNQETLDAMNKDIEKFNQQLTVLRGEFRTISAEQIQYPEGAFVCPTCKRPLDVEDVEAKQRELLENFNQNKSARLQANKTKGMSTKQALDTTVAKKETVEGKIASLKAELESLEIQLDQERSQIPEAQNVELLKQNDAACIALKNEISELQNQLTMEAAPVDVSDLREEKQKATDNLYQLQARLAKREQIKRADDEIQALEEKRLANNQALADAEKLEYIALSFQKDKDAELAKRINGLFKYVSFSFVSEQLNGGEKLTCVCNVNGTPYPDVNNAGKINAGLDIINAICTAKGITAPIFVDNAESVNDILPTMSQKVLLYVSNDKCLTIK